MKIKVIMWLSVLILSLSACASKSLSNIPANTNKEYNENKTLQIKRLDASTFKQDRVNNLLMFIDRFSNGTLEAQKKLLNETNRALIENKADLTERIKLAIMFSLPSSRVRDPAKAQVLLQDLLQENGLNPTESALTSLFYEHVLDDIKVAQKNKEDLKRLELYQQKLESLQQKYDALDKKLNDLKNIEKTISDRDSKASLKPVIKP
ncbi:MAG: hypothetical protein PSV17_04005 [Methylotenera sp.]|uniref:hypothetical protein n=1 Tax=Methylotenera sp. TaxID=2051956 RepID=UPI00248A69D5|nr:hypothetical protein [Methylotenera sp.]MDI1308582.1 hypothetical protein [Methylotenera sp.]